VIAIELVPAGVIRPLSHRVLRAGQPASAAAYAEDPLPDTVHVAAFDDSRDVVSCATLFPEAYPGEEFAGLPAWRLRGMATEERVRGQGIGAQVLARGLAEAKDRGAQLVWCNARAEAVPFYVRNSFEVIGEPFDIHGIGAHARMVVKL
jgi:predicted GNAT family N-acyltransferase